VTRWASHGDERLSRGDGVCHRVCETCRERGADVENADGQRPRAASVHATETWMHCTPTLKQCSRKFSLLDPDTTWVIAKQVDFVDSDPYTPETVEYDPIVGWTGNPSIGTMYRSLHTEFNKWLVDSEDSLPAFDVAQLFSVRNFESYVEGWASEDSQVPYTGAGGNCCRNCL